jgi:hypothetical protein
LLNPKLKNLSVQFVEFQELIFIFSGHGRVGNALLAKGHYVQAREAFQNGLHLDKNDKTCLEGIAEIESLMKDSKKYNKRTELEGKSVSQIIFKRTKAFIIMFILWVVYKNFKDGSKETLIDTAKGIVFDKRVK